MADRVKGGAAEAALLLFPDHAEGKDGAAIRRFFKNLFARRDDVRELGKLRDNRQELGQKWLMVASGLYCFARS